MAENPSTGNDTYMNVESSVNTAVSLHYYKYFPGLGPKLAKIVDIISYLGLALTYLIHV